MKREVLVNSTPRTIESAGDPSGIHIYKLQKESTREKDSRMARTGSLSCDEELSSSSWVANLRVNLIDEFSRPKERISTCDITNQ